MKIEDFYIYIIKDGMVKGSMNEEIFEWSTEPPTREGWYWAKTNKGIYMFNLVRGITGLYFESIGVWWEAGMEEYKITHWLGPLPLPEPPKQKGV